MNASAGQLKLISTHEIVTPNSEEYKIINEKQNINEQ